MLTLQDCVDLACAETGINPDEIAAVAEHEKLPYIVAVEKGAWMMEHTWVRRRSARSFRTIFPPPPLTVAGNMSTN